MSHYLIIIEKAKANYSAFSPDLPGCVSTGRTKKEALLRMEQAIQLHIEGLREDGLPVPKPHASAEYIAV